MQKRNTLVASVLALVVAAPVFAQGALVGIDALDDQIDDIQDAAVDEIDEGQDSQRYGPNQFAQGWTGNIALGFSATSGNTDTTDLDLAGRFRYGNGPWNHTFDFDLFRAQAAILNLFEHKISELPRVERSR